MTFRRDNVLNSEIFAVNPIGGVSYIKDGEVAFTRKNKGTFIGYEDNDITYNILDCRLVCDSLSNDFCIVETSGKTFNATLQLNNLLRYYYFSRCLFLIASSSPKLL